MQKGIVMEVGPHYWVVMTPEGEFLKVPTDERSVEPGDEICFTLKKERLALFKKRRSWIASGLAVALVTLFLLIPVIGPSQAQADSYVYLDLNPSLELGLDKTGKVIQVRPLNETGKKLVKGLDWKGFEVDRFVVTVLSKARADGYIRPQEGIIVSQTSSERNHVPQTQRTLQSIKQSVERDPELNQEELKVFTLSLPDLLRKRAEEMGISPAKYALWMLSKRDGQPIGSDELMALSTSDLMKRIDISPILRNPPSKDEWEDWIEEDDKLKEKGSENPDSKDKKEKDQSSQDPQKSKNGQDSSKDSSNRDNPSSEKPKGTDQKDPSDNSSDSEPSDPDRSDEKPGEGQQESPDNDPTEDEGKEPDDAEFDHSKTPLD